MRIGVIALLICLFTIVTVWADEKLPALKAGSIVYSNVTVTTVTPTDVYFTYDRGMANAKLKNLDPVWQKHFKYDPAKAETAEQKQKDADLHFKTEESAASLRPRPPNIDPTDPQSVMDAAIARVKEIVNQPVPQIARTPDMRVSTYSPGWFHPGAIKPDFDNVDIRATQQCQYGSAPYVTSDLNPGVVFPGSQVEFNAMTKYFYEDRTLPKKRLTEAEMLDVNRLYRIIGRCEKMLPPNK